MTMSTVEEAQRATEMFHRYVSFLQLVQSERLFCMLTFSIDVLKLLSEYNKGRIYDLWRGKVFAHLIMLLFLVASSFF